MFLELLSEDQHYGGGALGQVERTGGIVPASIYTESLPFCSIIATAGTVSQVPVLSEEPLCWWVPL